MMDETSLIVHSQVRISFVLTKEIAP